MFPIFNSLYRVHIINDKFCLREPSTGAYTNAVKKVKLITDAEGNIPASLWKTIHVLTCIHTVVNDECSTSIAGIFYNAFKKLENQQPLSAEEVMALPDEEFVEFLHNVADSIPLSAINEWFRIIDDELMVSQKKKEELKND
jgi:hypothetical protein